MLKYLGQTLHRYYGAIVQQPMPWRVIDRLASLEEVCEEKDAERDRRILDRLPAEQPTPAQNERHPGGSEK